MAWIWILVLSFVLAGCDKYYLSLRQIHVTPTYLASSHVGTPDPRQAKPPFGQKLLIDWTVPPEVLAEKPEVVLYLVFKDHEEKQIRYPIEYRSGYRVYDLLNDAFVRSKGLLTYRAEIVTESGKVYREWKHQLWVKLINLDEEERTSSSVEAQSKQGSVIETEGAKPEVAN